MLATMLSRMLLVELLVYGSCSLGLLALDRLSISGAIVFVAVAFIVMRMLVVLGSFLSAWIYRAPRPPEMRIGPLQTLGLLLSEYMALMLLYILIQPLEVLINRRVDKHASSRAPVLLVHGFFCNGAFWWVFRRSLSKYGFHHHYTINLEPPFAGIEHYAAQVADQVERICRETGADRVILIAHSMGGLVCRCYLQTLGDTAPVLQLITLGTPHHGTQLAKLVDAENTRQMQPGNDWLQALNQEESGSVPITSIYSWHDNVIAPQDSAQLPQAKNIAVAGIGHLGMAFSKRTHRLVLQQLR